MKLFPSCCTHSMSHMQSLLLMLNSIDTIQLIKQNTKKQKSVQNAIYIQLFSSIVTNSICLSDAV